MTRISGSVNSDGSKINGTGSSSGFNSTYTGTEYQITYKKAFTEMPTVLAHEINYDYRSNNAPLVIRISPTAC